MYDSGYNLLLNKKSGVRESIVASKIIAQRHMQL